MRTCRFCGEDIVFRQNPKGTEIWCYPDGTNYGCYQRSWDLSTPIEPVAPYLPHEPMTVEELLERRA